MSLGRVDALTPLEPGSDLGGRGPASTITEAPRWFTFHLGIGWDAATVAEVERRGALKRYLNHVLFIYAGLTAFFRDTDRTSPWLRVDVDGEIVEGWQCLVLNSNPYTYVGSRPFDVDPQATLDALPTLVVATRFGAGDLLSLSGAALRGGGLADHPSVRLFREFSEARVEALRSLPWQVDGDYLGEVGGMELSGRRVPAWLRGGR